MFLTKKFEDMSPTKLPYNYLRLFGVLNHEGRPWSLILTAYNFVMINISIFGCILYMVLGSGNIIDTIKAISPFTAYLHSYCKAVNILTNQKKVCSFLERIENLRTEIMENEENRPFIIKADKFLYKLIRMYTVLLLGFPFLLAVSNFITDYLNDFNNPHQIMQIWIPWNINELWPYVGGMFFILILTTTSSGYYASFSTLLFVFTIQTSAFIKVLRNQLEMHGPRGKSIYKQHSKILQLIQEYNNLFSGQLYLEILISSLQPCGYGFALIKAIRKNDPEILNLIFLTTLMMSAPFIVCACGQEIKTQTEKLHASLYMYNWYEEKPKIRRNLLTMMTITVKPKTINYRKLITFDYIAFCTVAQGIYSYLAMIANFVTE